MDKWHMHINCEKSVSKLVTRVFMPISRYSVFKISIMLNKLKMNTKICFCLCFILNLHFQFMVSVIPYGSFYSYVLYYSQNSQFLIENDWINKTIKYRFTNTSTSKLRVRIVLKSSCLYFSFKISKFTTVSAYTGRIFVKGTPCKSNFRCEAINF